MSSVNEPFPIFYDADGTPLDNGMIYVGAAGQAPRADPIPVYYDADFTIPATQPIRTLGGRPAYQGAPARIYINAANYSIEVQNRFGTPITGPTAGDVFTAADISFSPSGTVQQALDARPTSATLAASGGSALVGFLQSGTGAVARTAQAKLRETMSVKDFGAAGDGTTNDAAAIQAAIDAAEVLATTQAGARVVFPAGNYRINSGLRVRKGRIEIEFTQGAQLVPHGSFDTLRFESATAATFIFHNKLINGLFDETNKTGGKTLVGKYLAEADFTLTSAAGWDGIQLDTFNTVDLDARVTGLRSASAIYCLVRGGGSVGDRSDVLRINKMVMGGTYVDGQNGLIIDGFVHTVVGKSVYGVNVGGRVLVTQNTIGASDNPAFLNFWDFETDFQKNEAIFLAEGQIAEFQGAICNGSRAASNIVVGSSFKDARFIGGRSTGAAQAGIAIQGADVAVVGMKCMSNSSNQFTGTLNTFPGILVGGSSSGTRILGCRSGDPSTSTFQSYGIQIDTEATNFIVKDNDVRSNVGSGVVNGAGTSSSKIVADNIA